MQLAAAVCLVGEHVDTWIIVYLTRMCAGMVREVEGFRALANEIFTGVSQICVPRSMETCSDEG
jgi:hypothetical protein